jgi:hypothetical protein
MRRRIIVLTIVLLSAVGSAAAAADAPGYPSRDPNLDVLPGFRNPPPGYGEVGFYWWLGDPLTKERLTWQLDQLANKGVAALQVNYAHSDKGGRQWGLTFPSDPPLFSPAWWDLFGWFLKQARQRGMAASLSDYTLGWAGNGWYMDEMLRDHPDMRGAALARETHDCAGGACQWELQATPVGIAAYRIEGGRMAAGGAPIDLRARVRGGRTLEWTAPEGQWRVVSVYAKEESFSIDPMHALSGQQMIEKFFQRFEDRNPGESGKGLNFFFSDELSFGVRGWLWNRDFGAEFQRRKGYDVVPELASLFEETGPRAVKVRLDYSDVMVALSEANYFKPLYEWHHSRGMLYGCDHGGRGRDVTEFGDYFRTQRWMTGPGNDQPNLTSDVVKNKVSSSITHLYERERTWLEGYYGSGWGTTSAQIADATWRNFVQGQNLLTLHGLYYSTHGGWWEWAPPCNHFHMPYWAHMSEFLHTVERMSYVLSQGRHRADVAIMYPVAAMEAGLSGKESVSTAFSLGRYLYSQGIDFDFIDFESLERARVEDGKLKVAGEEYRALVLPAMRAVRHSTLAKAVAFKRGGGATIILGAAPQASERQGDGDPEVLAMARELATSGLKTPEEVAAKIDSAFRRDFVCEGGGAQPAVLHRKVGSRDLYFVYGVARNRQCTFRATGGVEVWDPWSGGTSALGVVRQADGITTLRMPLEATEAQLIVFDPGRAATVAAAESAEAAAVVAVEGDWDFELAPTLDNRFGDYRLPAARTLIGAEARRFRYADEGPATARASDPQFDDSQWAETTYTYGPHFWKLGPLPAGAGTSAIEERLVAQATIDPAQKLLWGRYEFSWRWGIEGDPGHQGYHGLKEEVPADFIGLGKLLTQATTTAYEAEAAGSRYYLWTTVRAPRAMRARIVGGGDLRPAAVWIGGARLDSGAEEVTLRAGANPLLLRYDGPGRGSFALMDAESPRDWTQTYPLASVWYNRPGLLVFDTRPGDQNPVGWYRTTAPPGLRGITMVVRGTPSVWIDGRPVMVTKGDRGDGVSTRYRIALPHPMRSPAKVAIRVAQERGVYGGAAFPEPVVFDCAGGGTMGLGDWSRIEGLASYSGGAWYRKTVKVEGAKVGGRVVLDLGQVSSSAEVRVNGRRAGVKLAPPFRVDISGLVKSGENRVEVLVYSALSNHYSTIPTKYLRASPSGLLGPVRLLMGGTP